MHTVPLARSHIPSLATLYSSAFRDDELFRWLQPNLSARPRAIEQWAAQQLRQDLCASDVAVRVAVSDEEDEWWDGGLGEIMGYAIWQREGKWNEEMRDEEKGIWRTGKGLMMGMWNSLHVLLLKSYILLFVFGGLCKHRASLFNFLPPISQFSNQSRLFY